MVGLRKFLAWCVDGLIVVIVLVVFSGFFKGGTYFEFDSTSQFIVTEACVESFHTVTPVWGDRDRVVFGVSDESSSPVVFEIGRWWFVNDSTMVGYGPGHVVEWQRRMGEQAVVATIKTADGVVVFHVYEFWRDSL